MFLRGSVTVNLFPSTLKSIGLIAGIVLLVTSAIPMSAQKINEQSKSGCSNQQNSDSNSANENEDEGCLVQSDQERFQLGRSKSTPRGMIDLTYNGNRPPAQNARGGESTIYTWDNRSNLAKVTVNGEVRGLYTYNWKGLRTSKLGAEGLIRYHYDDNSILLQTSATGEEIARYDYGPDRLLSMYYSGNQGYPQGREWFLYDALGTVVNTVRPGASSTTRSKYDAWGNSRGNVGTTWNTFGFTGHEHDSNTGLIYAKARFYDPDTGRFLSEDPATGKPDNPPSLHKYLYAYANPTAYTDPTGKYAEGGHYYTAYYVAVRVGLSGEEAREIAFYSQVPDEVSDYDAIANQLSVTNEENTKRRDLNHPSLHALSGGNSELESAQASKSVAEAPSVASAGVRVHRLGDSYAHRIIGEEDKLYPLGPGHAKDLTAPDVIQHRPDLYLDYVESLAKSLIQFCGERCNSSDNDKKIQEIVRSLTPIAGVPRGYEDASDEDLKALAQQGIRALLEEESQRIVESGGTPLDDGKPLNLDFIPENHDTPFIGKKTTEDLLEEIYGPKGPQDDDKIIFSPKNVQRAITSAQNRYKGDVEKGFGGITMNVESSGGIGSNSVPLDSKPEDREND